jgi:hypothetical protein
MKYQQPTYIACCLLCMSEAAALLYFARALHPLYIEALQMTAAGADIPWQMRPGFLLAMMFLTPLIPLGALIGGALSIKHPSGMRWLIVCAALGAMFVLAVAYWFLTVPIENRLAV